MKRLVQLTMMVVVVVMTGPAFAADKKKSESDRKPYMEMTKERREEMAVMHEKMATCLRSEASMDECHKEMRTSCQEKMGKDGCPMMEGMKRRGK